MCVCAKSSQLYKSLSDPLVCSPPDSSVHGVSQARILSGLPCPPPRDLPNLEIEPMSLTCPALAGGFFTNSENCKKRYSNPLSCKNI